MGGNCSFCDKFITKSSQKTKDLLLNLFKMYVDRDNQQIYWLSSEYHSRLANLYRSQLKGKTMIAKLTN